MAIHNFNYTYEYVGVKTMPLSRQNNTQIIREVCVAVTAIDQADITQTITENMYAPLSDVYSYRHDGLPENFINIDDITDAKIIEWYKNTTSTEALDIYFTWQIYGPEEVDPVLEPA